MNHPMPKSRIRSHPTRARRPTAWAAGTLAALLLAACGGGSGGGSSSPPATTARLELTLAGLQNPGAGAVYEGWLMVDGVPVSTGRFSVDEQGMLSQSSFNITKAQADRASDFVLTIEPAQGDAPTPAKTNLVAGSFDSTRREAVLSVADPMETTGGVVLATPNGEALDDEAQDLPRGTVRLLR